jgi:predicted lipid-binding transport protein (Tim44 family)
MRSVRCIHPILALTVVAAAVFLLVAEAMARPSGGGSFGSRGNRTFSAPPSTATAPRAATPIERTMTQPGSPGAVAAAPRPASPAAGGFFNRPGLLGGLAAGFLGAGLIGLLMGNGLLGGLGGFASVLGLLLQVALVVIVARLAWTWWQRRNGLATAGGPSLRNAIGDTPQGGRDFAYGGASAMPAGDTIRIAKADFDAFEALLGEVSVSFGKEDLTELRSRATPEMLSYFSEDLVKNASRGLVNEISDVKLLQGDLAEAWREGDLEYATVAMRYSLIDATVERATGRVVEGSRSPHEVTELWTFVRSRGANWILSAIQQG